MNNMNSNDDYINKVQIKMSDGVIVIVDYKEGIT
jgi:hypothetical protein